MVALAAIAVTVSVAGCGGDGKLSNDYVTVNQYKGLEIAKVEKKEVSDDDVEQTIQSRLLSSGKTDGLTKDGAAEDGDWVNIDYSGSVDGTAFDGGTSTGYDLQLGSGTFLAATDDYKGFEEQIVGHKAGEEFDIQVQFPDAFGILSGLSLVGVQVRSKTFFLPFQGVAKLYFLLQLVPIEIFGGQFLNLRDDHFLQPVHGDEGANTRILGHMPVGTLQIVLAPSLGGGF